MIRLQINDAACGDCIFVSFGDDENNLYHIIIDSGTAICCTTLSDFIQNVDKVEALILTHYDDDHIGGFVSLAEDQIGLIKEKVKSVWFNCGKKLSEEINETGTLDINISTLSCNTSSISGKKLYDLLIKNKIDLKYHVEVSEKWVSIHGAVLKIISPSREKLKKLVKKYDKETNDINTSGENDCNSSVTLYHIR